MIGGRSHPSVAFSRAECQSSINKHSKSFSLASRLLPGGAADSVAALYAWCRRADDAIDVSAPELSEPEAPRAALSRLRHELTRVYAGDIQHDPVLAAFGEVLRAHHIPMHYPAELLTGMEMDVNGHEYATIDELLVYGYRVASTVGLMMCHVLGVSRVSALRHAAHLGLAMQLTNICRDVMEDWQRGRLYLPADLLARHGVSQLRVGHGTAFPDAAVDGCRGAIEELLALAARYYESSDAGLEYLSMRSAVAVNAARRIYSAIGSKIASQGHDLRAPRAVVSNYKKLMACATACVSTLARKTSSLASPFAAVPLDTLTYGPELIAL
jgi:phytoene synthase